MPSAVFIAVPNPPTLQVVLPRFSLTYLVWRDPERYAGDIIGVQIHYLIDCLPLNIPQLGSGVHQFSIFGIKGSEGKTHSISLRARTTAGWGNYSTPVEFVFRPIGKAVATPGFNVRVGEGWRYMHPHVIIANCCEHGSGGHF